jgi:hypothetical protein
MVNCTGIRKTHPSFAEAKDGQANIKMRIANKYKDLDSLLTRLINQNAVSEPLQQKIDALKTAFNASISKKKLLPTDLEDAEKILLQLRRIYTTQKAASDKRLKEEKDAASAACVAECAAEGFIPQRSD